MNQKLSESALNSKHNKTKQKNPFGTFIRNAIVGIEKLSLFFIFAFCSHFCHSKKQIKKKSNFEHHKILTYRGRNFLIHCMILSNSKICLNLSHQSHSAQNYDLTNNKQNPPFFHIKLF